MKNIAIIARKGGSGKTTVAVNLALAAHRRGHAVELADTDPQGSSAEVLRVRKAEGPMVVQTTGEAIFAGGLHHQGAVGLARLQDFAGRALRIGIGQFHRIAAPVGGDGQVHRHRGLARTALAGDHCDVLHPGSPSHPRPLPGC